MKILETKAVKETAILNEEESIRLLRQWNGCFRSVAQAINTVDEFLTRPEDFEGKEDRLRLVFNNIEILKSSISLDSNQKEICSKVTDIVFDMAGKAF